MRMLRVASVPYLVGRPLDSGLEDEPGIRFWTAPPSELVRGLRAQEIDVALASSIELFRQPGYTFLDGICVGGEGFVSSVQVFLKEPLEKIERVDLDPASRTSATLAQIVWPGSLASKPRFYEVDDDPKHGPGQAWLRIGDACMREYLAPDAPQVLNPSEEWREKTGLPFVFALWVVRPGVDVTPWIPAFTQAFIRGQSRLEDLALETASSWGVPNGATRRYLFEECSYDLGERMAPSLYAFRDEAAKLDLARAELNPEAIPVAVPQ